jgi:hypothetical protein
MAMLTSNRLRTNGDMCILLRVLVTIDGVWIGE